MMTRRLGLATALGAVLIVSAACSGGAASAATTSPDAGGNNGLGFTSEALCALVTTADVGAVLGSSVGPGVPDGENSPSCTWTAADSSGATIAATDVASVGQLPFALQGGSGSQLVPVAGLGDRAYYASGAMGQTAELDIAKGGRAVTITLSLADPSTTLAQQEAAEKTLGVASLKNW